MAFNNAYLIEELKDIEETDAERIKREKEEALQKIKRNNIIEFSVYIILCLILIYCMLELTKNNKNNKNGVQVGGLVVGGILKGFGDGVFKVVKEVGNAAFSGIKSITEGIGEGIIDSVGTISSGVAKSLQSSGSKKKDKSSSSKNKSKFDFSSSFKSDNYDSGSYSDSIRDIRGSGASNIVMTLLIGGFLCLFAFMIPTLLPILLLFVMLLICKTFAMDQYKQIMK
jgi:hypothetical protein